MIFGWGGKSGPNRDAHAPGDLAHDRRGRPRLAVRHRRRQAARRPRHPADPRPGPRRPARGAGAAVRRRARPPPRRDGRRHARRARPASPRPSAPRPSTPSPRSPASTSPRARSRSCARPPTSGPRSCARRSAPTSSSWARRRRPASPGTSLFGALPEAIAQRARPTVIVVKTREPIGRQTFEQLAQKAETLAAADRAAEESRAVPARVERWFAEANFHHSEFARPRPADLAQGEAGPDGQPRAADAQRGGDDRADRPARRPRDAGAVPAARRAPRHRLGVDRRHPRDRRGRGRARRPAPRRAARYGSFRGKGEALWKSLYETSGDLVVWADTDVRNWHPRMVYGTLGPLLVEPRLST